MQLLSTMKIFWEAFRYCYLRDRIHQRYLRMTLLLTKRGRLFQRTLKAAVPQRGVSTENPLPELCDETILLKGLN